MEIFATGFKHTPISIHSGCKHTPISIHNGWKHTPISIHSDPMDLCLSMEEEDDWKQILIREIEGLDLSSLAHAATGTSKKRSASQANLSLPASNPIQTLKPEHQDFLLNNRFQMEHCLLAAKELQTSRRMDIVAMELVVTYTPHFRDKSSNVEFPLFVPHNLRALAVHPSDPEKYVSIELSPPTAALMYNFENLRSIYPNYVRPGTLLRDRLVRGYMYLPNPIRRENDWYWETQSDKHGSVLVAIFADSIEYLTFLVEEAEDVVPRLTDALGTHIRRGSSTAKNAHRAIKQEFGVDVSVERYGPRKLKQVKFLYEAQRDQDGNFWMISYKEFNIAGDVVF